MIYEEAIVDGVLCWRNSPRDCKGHGPWIPKTPQELTAMLMEARRSAPWSDGFDGTRNGEIEHAVITLREITQQLKGRGIGAVMLLEEHIQALENKIARLNNTDRRL